MSKGNHLIEGNFLKEAHDLKVAGVNLQESAGVFGNSLDIVGRMGLVGGADLNQSTAGLSHNLRYTESAADFDQLTTGNDNFLAFCHGA